MKNQLDQTIDSYRQNFDGYVERTPSIVSGVFMDWMDEFAALLKDGATIFEIGSAGGRDARYFASKGFDVVCTDVIPVALQKLAREGFEVADFDFRDEPRREWIGAFDGIFANAVLLHAAPDIFENVLKSLMRVLKKGGVVGFSLKMGEGGAGTSEKLGAPRFFYYYTEQKVREILSKLPLEILSVANSEDGKWIYFTAKYTD